MGIEICTGAKLVQYRLRRIDCPNLYWLGRGNPRFECQPGELELALGKDRRQVWFEDLQYLFARYLQDLRARTCSNRPGIRA
jgi:hypothetical protein